MAGQRPVSDQVNIDPEKPHAFLSYTRFDDRFLDGGISALREALEQAVQARTGKPFRIFQDVDDIKPGDAWLTKLNQAIEAAQLFIPILTPSFFTSDFCRREAKAFLDYEERAGRVDLVLPIYLIDCDRLDNIALRESDEIASRLHEHQYDDWRQQRFKLRDGETRPRIDELAGAIAYAVTKNVEITPQPVETDASSIDLAMRFSELQSEAKERDQAVEAARARNEQLEAELAEQGSEVKRLAEAKAVLERRAEEATLLKQEIAALRRAPNVTVGSVVDDKTGQPETRLDRFRSASVLGVASLALLIGAGSGWWLGREHASSNNSISQADQLQKQVVEQNREIESRAARNAELETELTEMKDSASVERASLKAEIKTLTERLTAAEQMHQQMAPSNEVLAANTALENLLSPQSERSMASDQSLPVSNDLRRPASGLPVSFHDCAGCPEMVVIAKGTFLMGAPLSDMNGKVNERPYHKVSIGAFALSKFEVTFAEWDFCVADGGCEHKPNDQEWGRKDRPVINVSWYDAREYADWLTRKTKAEYRLPSEAEWEYAARAGTITAYFWGNDIGVDRANCKGCGSAWDSKQTSPVGRFAPNSFGLNDMHGNVWEWVQDSWHASYEGAPTDGRAWQEEQDSLTARVIRGGNWTHIPKLLRSAHRHRSMPVVRAQYLGFRIARNDPDKK